MAVAAFTHFRPPGPLDEVGFIEGNERGVEEQFRAGFPGSQGIGPVIGIELNCLGELGGVILFHVQPVRVWLEGAADTGAFGWDGESLSLIHI